MHEARREKEQTLFVRAPRTIISPLPSTLARIPAKTDLFPVRYLNRNATYH
jgi:hypothetical protein